MTARAIDDVLTKLESMTAPANWQAVDDGYSPGQLAGAGGCYALNASTASARGKELTGDLPPPPYLWPMAKSDYAPTTVRDDLVTAAALILRELQRMDRAAG